jgi:hypothetical protein
MPLPLFSFYSFFFHFSEQRVGYQQALLAACVVKKQKNEAASVSAVSGARDACMEQKQKNKAQDAEASDAASTHIEEEEVGVPSQIAAKAILAAHSHRLLRNSFKPPPL